jgi:hypothetical protein
MAFLLAGIFPSSSLEFNSDRVPPLFASSLGPPLLRRKEETSMLIFSQQRGCEAQCVCRKMNE